jgi:signal transduction histidine kinase
MFTIRPLEHVASSWRLAGFCLLIVAVTTLTLLFFCHWGLQPYLEKHIQAHQQAHLSAEAASPWQQAHGVRLDEVMTELYLYIGASSLIALALCSLPLYWFARSVLRPIRGITTATRGLHEPDHVLALSHRNIAIPELKTLAAVVNASHSQVAYLSQELQSTNDQLAHELRTPLARIRGNLEALHDHTDSPKAREAAARSLEEIDRSKQLIQSILTIRGCDHGVLNLNVKPTAIGEMLENLVDLFTPAAEQLGLGLGVKVDVDFVAELDRELMNQAISNLLDNALTYTPSGGAVTVRWQAQATWVTVFVEDTGPGVHPDEVALIWERYARGSASFKTRHASIGLGLSLVRSIVSAHGGEVGVSNLPTGGASFWIRLPASPGQRVG